MRNAGKTAAIVDSLCIDWTIAERLPEIPDYKNVVVYSANATIEAADDFGFFPMLDQDRGIDLIHIDGNEFSQMLAEKTFLWVYGYIKVSDLIGAIYINAFCYYWRINPPLEWTKPRPPSVWLLGAHAARFIALKKITKAAITSMHPDRRRQITAHRHD
jgi:hypothetical protein